MFSKVVNIIDCIQSFFIFMNDKHDYVHFNLNVNINQMSRGDRGTTKHF